MILVFDTSIEGFSIGIFHADGSLVGQLVNEEPYAHTEFLVSSAQDLLQQSSITFNELTQIVTTCGPGSFTGIRVGLATAAGLRSALCIPVIAVNTLCALVLSAPQSLLEESAQFHAVLDTKCGELYHQAFVYRDSGLRSADEPKSISLEKVLEISQGHTIITHPSSVSALGGIVAQAVPVALQGVLEAVKYAAANDLQPMYVRSANIIKPKKNA